MANRIEQLYENNNKVYPQEKEWELIWENNETTNFPTQTINLDLSKYSKLYIFYSNRAPSIDNCTSHIILKNNPPSFAIGFQSAQYPYGRMASFDDNGVTFSGGYYTSSSSDSGRAIPRKIYGII